MFGEDLFIAPRSTLVIASDSSAFEQYFGLKPDIGGNTAIILGTLVHGNGDDSYQLVYQGYPIAVPVVSLLNSSFI